MRQARVGDHWRRVYGRSYTSRIEEFEYCDLSALGSGSFKFGGGGISAICGANGVGKTTLLKALLTVLDPGQARTRDAQLRLTGSTLRSGLTLRNTQVERIHIVDEDLTDPPSLNVEVLHVDFSRDVPALISGYLNQDNLDEYLEAVEPRYLTPDEIVTLSYIVGKDYTSVRTYELEFGADGRVIPYFLVESGGASYRTETMGLGELSAHYALWQLQRSNKGAIVLLEEPETFLAPASQIALLDALAKYSDKKNAWTVVTTHSPAILTNIPANHVLFLYRDNNGVQVHVPHSQDEFLPTLGVQPEKRGIVLVEDKAAREFAKIWVGHYAPHLVQTLEFKDAGDESKIQLALTFPRVSNWLTIVGLFDGDGRQRVREYYSDEVRDTSRKWPFTFLPGSASPEIILRQAAKAAPHLLADKLGRSVEVVKVAMAQMDGRDPHDWLEGLPNLLGVEYSTLIKALFEVWIDSSNATKQQSEQAFLEFESAAIKSLESTGTQDMNSAAGLLLEHLRQGSLKDSAEALEETAEAVREECSSPKPNKRILRLCVTNLSVVVKALPEGSVRSAACHLEATVRAWAFNE